MARSENLDDTVRIQVYFDPSKNPAVTADPERVEVKPNTVVDIDWVQAGSNTKDWRFAFIGFMDPVGEGSEIEIPRVHPSGVSVTTRDTNKPVHGRSMLVSTEQDKIYRYKIYVRQQQGRDRETIWASDPEIINRRDLGDG